jgi:hypothetical protein
MLALLFVVGFIAVCAIICAVVLLAHLLWWLFLGGVVIQVFEALRPAFRSKSFSRVAGLVFGATILLSVALLALVYFVELNQKRQHEAFAKEYYAEQAQSAAEKQAVARFSSEYHRRFPAVDPLTNDRPVAAPSHFSLLYGKTEND